MILIGLIYIYNFGKINLKNKKINNLNVIVY